MHAVEAPVLERLAALAIPYTLHRHPPVHTVEEARILRGELDAIHVKNLFLRDKREQMWLVTVREDRPLDLKALRDPLGARGNPSFGSAERLRTFLGVEPGSVTPLAAIHDREGRVQVWLDESLRGLPRVGAHPNHNAATVVLSAEDLVRYLRSTGHEPAWL